MMGTTEFLKGFPFLSFSFFLLPLQFHSVSIGITFARAKLPQGREILNTKNKK